MNQKLFIVIILGLMFIFVSCKAIDTVEKDLELAGYQLVDDETVDSSEYNYYKIIENDIVVGFVYEFSSYRKARDYYDTHALENDTITWVIHNQLIVGSYDQMVINTIVN